MPRIGAPVVPPGPGFPLELRLNILDVSTRNEEVSACAVGSGPV